MEQYLSMEEVIILSKEGKPRRVIDFRNRNIRTNSEIFFTTVTDRELLRTDLLARRLYNSVLEIGNIIDTNDKDVFSFVKNESIKFGGEIW